MRVRRSAALTSASATACAFVVAVVFAKEVLVPCAGAAVAANAKSRLQATARYLSRATAVHGLEVRLQSICQNSCRVV